jgi:hypothetical protein
MLRRMNEKINELLLQMAALEALKTGLLRGAR